MPRETRPATPLNKGPRPGMKYLVGTNDSLESVAKSVGMPVQDLLLHNFGTVVPEEINWYLREHIKCTKTTHDGRNWCFSNEPGKPKHQFIFIPPSVPPQSAGTPRNAVSGPPPAFVAPPASYYRWMRLADMLNKLPKPREEAGQSVKNDLVTFLLTNPYVHRVRFVIFGLTIGPKGYHDVANAVASGKIKVFGDSDTPDSPAHYDVRWNWLVFEPGANVAGPGLQPFLVHEATHAILDSLNLGHYSHHVDEAVAYLAEAVFLELAGRPPLSMDPLRVVSHEIARKVIAGTYVVSRADSGRLLLEVAKHPHYSASPVFKYDGF